MRSNVGYYDLEGHFLYATPSLASSVGMTPEKLLGRTWYEIGVPPDVVDELEAARRSVAETGTPVRRHVSFSLDDGHVSSEFLIKPVVDVSGAVVGTVVQAWDVEQSETPGAGQDDGQLRLDRAYGILSAVDQVLLRTRDPNVMLYETCRICAGIGGFQLAWVGLWQGNEADVRLVCQAGRDEGMLPALSISTRDDPTGHGVVGTSIRENRTVIVGDVQTNPRMDAWRPFFDRLGYRTAAGFPIRIAGKSVGCLALYSSEDSHFDASEARLFEQIVDDVSAALTSIQIERERAEAQEALAASERRYRELFDVGPHPLAVYDRETLRFLAVNEAAVATYGYSREEFLQMTIADIVAAEAFPKLVAEVTAVRPGVGYRPSGPWPQHRKDGSTLLADVSTHELEFDGRPARLVQSIDVTERQRFESQMAEAARMEAMGHLAGGIAHDFNNLMTAVNGYADILVAGLGDDPRAEDAREIRRAGARATELTKQVLAFSRRQSLAPRPVDLNTAVTSVTQMLRRLIGEQINLATKLEATPVVVRADPGQLEQILVNLAVNARDAMPEGGQLEIEVASTADASSLARDMRGPAALLKVSDTGCGMDDATLARAFEPFFTTKLDGKGTGLGLSTARGIVLQASGRIWAESSPGAGTTMYVLLPAVDEPLEVPVPARRNGDSECAPAVVLVVEDDAGVRSFAVSTLERAGHQVLVASTPAQALALSRGLEESIDVVLTDLVLPGGNGLDLAAMLVAERPGLHVIVTSGYDSDLAAPLDGSFRFLAKPFHPEDLLAALKACVAPGVEDPTR